MSPKGWPPEEAGEGRLDRCRRQNWPKKRCQWAGESSTEKRLWWAHQRKSCAGSQQGPGERHSPREEEEQVKNEQHPPSRSALPFSTPSVIPAIKRLEHTVKQLERKGNTTDKQLAITNPFLIGTASSTRRLKASVLPLPYSAPSCSARAVQGPEKNKRYSRAQRNTDQVQIFFGDSFQLCNLPLELLGEEGGHFSLAALPRDPGAERRGSVPWEKTIPKQDAREVSSAPGTGCPLPRGPQPSHGPLLTFWVAM